MQAAGRLSHRFRRGDAGLWVEGPLDHTCRGTHMARRSWGEDALLRSAYRSALECARELGVRSVALPLISAGIFGFPIDRALAIATSEISAFLDRVQDVEVRLVVFDRAAFAACLADYGEVAACVDEEYVDAAAGRDRMGDLRLSMPACGSAR